MRTRRRPVWTRAMRQAAAEHGRKGGRAAKRAAGLLSWHTRTPAERAEIVARLRAAGGRQSNTTAKARAAQARRARVQGRTRTHMTQAQAEFLADIGVLRRAPAPELLAASRAPAVGRPRPEDYPGDAAAWKRAVDAWDAAEWARVMQRRMQEGGDE